VTYAVRFRPRAAKQLAALPKGVRTTIAQVIEALAKVPRPSGAVYLQGTDFLRVRVRDYRVVYEVHDDVLVVLVVRVAHRREVYRGL
jgi:mRNA interferase RelE/StbE